MMSPESYGSTHGFVNYRYTHPSKHAVDGLGSSAYQAIEL
eukprot:SAG22_NODE_191_length_15699_cov_19.660192_16_plen_40_part_00